MRACKRAAAAAAIAGTFIGAPAAMAQAPQWAPAGEATITPGVQVITEGAQCTSNFVFHEPDGTVYLGMAGHCAGTGGPTDTDGCAAGSLPLGTPVEVEGAQQPGRLAYSSWLAMQDRQETDADACAFNDFALVEIDAADADAVNPSVPFWGGPTGLNTTGTELTDRVFSYGDSSLRLGIELLSPKDGGSLGTSAGGWNHRVFTLTPGIPGDSGSAFLDSSGRALGVLSTLALLPLPATNGVGDLRLALDYMDRAGGPDVQLAHGTEPFRPRTILGL